MGLDAATAAPIYGMYTSMVYLMSLPGGWIADRLLGQRRAVLYGGILIASGHFSLAVATTATFYLGLVLIVLGTGLLKPNISVIVGQLYAQKDVRRDAGVLDLLHGHQPRRLPRPARHRVSRADRQLQSAAHRLGPRSELRLALGLRRRGRRHDARLHSVRARRHARSAPRACTRRRPALRPRTRSTVAAPGSVLAPPRWCSSSFGVGLATGSLPITAEQIVGAYGYLLLAITVGVLRLAVPRDRAGRARSAAGLSLIVVFFVAAALFWSVFEQAGSTLNLFADRSTDNTIFGWSFPSSCLQSLNALFIFMLAPVFAWLWVRLGPREPTSPAKFAVGLVGVGLGFLVLVPGAQIAGTGVKVGVIWLFSST